MNIRKKTLASLLFITIFSSYTQAANVLLNPNEGWFGDNRQKLDAIINQYGTNSPTYDANHKPIAAFDWDNTMMKNDIGEATLLWMMTKEKLKRPKSFSQMNPWLTKEALAELEKNCGDSSEYLPTRVKPLCADTLLNIYHGKTLEHGAVAWSPSPDPERIFPPYFFYAQLFSGYTPEEIRQFTEEAFRYNVSNKINQTQKVGTQEYPAFVRIYEPMINLVSVLKENGFDVWIISASIQPSVEIVANKVGIDSNHVIGVRQILNSRGQLTDTFQGCGPYLDGNKEIISNRLGKRCWLNKIIFKVQNPQKMLLPTPITFAAGDSDGDLVFLKDAQGGRLVINKNNPELLCNALQNTDKKWIINPMFIQPKPVLGTVYNCKAFHIPDQKEN